jgi:hypothetical protein
MKMATDTKLSNNKEAGYSQKQLFKRINVKLMSLVSSNGKSYAGFIHDVSEEGLAFETYDFAPTLKELSPKKIIKLTVKIPSGEMLNLNCEIIWSSKHSPLRLLQNYTTHKIGMRIVDPPSKYKEYVKALQ